MLTQVKMPWVLTWSASVMWSINRGGPTERESGYKSYPVLQSYIRGPSTTTELIADVNWLRNFINKNKTHSALYYAEAMKYINKIDTPIWTSLTLEEKANVYRFVADASDYVHVVAFYKNYRF